MLKVSKILVSQSKVAVGPPPAQTTQNRATDPSLAAPQHIQAPQEKESRGIMSASGSTIQEAAVKLIYNTFKLTDHNAIKIVYGVMAPMAKLPNSGITIVDAHNGDPASASMTPQAFDHLRTVLKKVVNDNRSKSQTTSEQGESLLDKSLRNTDKWIAANPGGGLMGTTTINGQTDTVGHLNIPKDLEQ